MLPSAARRGCRTVANGFAGRGLQQEGVQVTGAGLPRASAREIGLGIERGLAQAENAHQLYKQHGLGARDDAIAMQYPLPGWTFNPKRPALDR